MAKIISPTQAAAQAAYMRENNIAMPETKKEPAALVIPNKKPFVEGLTGCDKSFSVYIEGINMAAYIPSLTYMNDKDIVTALLKRYEGTYDAISRMTDFNRIKQFVFTQRVYKGVCLCARQIFGVDVTQQDWMKDFLKGNRIYWCKVPYNCESGHEIIQVIKFRVEKLKEILKMLEDE